LPCGSSSWARQALPSRSWKPWRRPGMTSSPAIASRPPRRTARAATGRLAGPAGGRGACIPVFLLRVLR
jgi:hypothetical protein